MNQQGVHELEALIMRSLVIAGAALLFAAVAGADVVHLKNGKSIEGKVTVKGDKVVVEIPHGTVSFPRSKVLRIERKVSSVEVYEQKHKALPPGDVEARINLAAWCRRQNMGNRSEALLQEVLALDPDNATARKLLGFVMHAGKWMKPEEKFRALGLVRFEKQWHKPESVVAIKKARAAAQKAEEDRKRAELELKIRVAEVEKLRVERARLEAERARIEAERLRLYEERLRLERLFVRYPHFKVIGDAVYYYPDYPECRKGVIIIRTHKRKKRKDDSGRGKGDSEEKPDGNTKAIAPALGGGAGG